jgi:hypothetical protein
MKKKASKAPGTTRGKKPAPVKDLPLKKDTDKVKGGFARRPPTHASAISKAPSTNL